MGRLGTRLIRNQARAVLTLIPATRGIKGDLRWMSGGLYRPLDSNLP